ncbi:tetratricopeptide repeat protein [candidate division KSB1 bacterium]
MNFRHHKITGFLTLTLIALTAFIQCSGDPSPQKIQLAARDVQSEETEAAAESVEGQSEFGLQNPEQEQPTILVLPFETDVNSDMEWVHSVFTDMIGYLISQYHDLQTYPVSSLQKITNRYQPSDNEELLSIVLQNEPINYYMSGSLTQDSGGFLLNYTVHDGNSKATVLDLERPAETINDVVQVLNEMVVDVHGRLVEYPDMEKTPYRTTFRALDYYIRGDIAMRELDIKTAISMYTACLDEDRSFGKAYVTILSLYFQHYTDVFPTVAEPYLMSAFQFNEDLSETERILLAAYNNFYFKKYEEALSNFSLLISKFSSSPEGYIGEAIIYLTLNQPDAALAVLESNEDLFSLNIPFLRTKHKVYNKLGDYDRALTEVKEYQELTGSCIVSLTDEAVLHYNWGRSNGALAVLDEALIRDPEYYEALILSGEIYFNQLRFQESIDVFSRSLYSLSDEKRSQARELYEYLFISYVYSGQFNAAKNIAENLIEKGYRSSNFKNTLQVASYLTLLDLSLGKESNLIHAMSSLMGIQLPDFQTARVLALISAKADNKGYESLFQKFAATIEHVNRVQYQVLTELSSGYKSFYNGDYSSALNSLRKVIEYEYNPVVSYHIAQSLHETGDIDKAGKEIQLFYKNLILEDFENAFILPQFYFLQAEMLEKSEDRISALRIYRKIVSMWGDADTELEQLQIVNEKILRLISN